MFKRKVWLVGICAVLTAASLPDARAAMAVVDNPMAMAMERRKVFIEPHPLPAFSLTSGGERTKPDRPALSLGGGPGISMH